MSCEAKREEGLAGAGVGGHKEWENTGGVGNLKLFTVVRAGPLRSGCMLEIHGAFEIYQCLHLTSHCVWGAVKALAFWESSPGNASV